MFNVFSSASSPIPGAEAEVDPEVQLGGAGPPLPVTKRSFGYNRTVLSTFMRRQASKKAHLCAFFGYAPLSAPRMYIYIYIHICVCIWHFVPFLKGVCAAICAAYIYIYMYMRFPCFLICAGICAVYIYIYTYMYICIYKYIYIYI